MKSGFISLHPLVCFFYYVGVFLFAMIFFHPLFLLTAILFMIGLNFTHDGGIKLRGLLPYYLVMGGSIAICNPLFSHRGRVILTYFMDQPITLEAVFYGVTLMLSLLLILLTFLSFQQIITTDKFMYLFSGIAPKTALIAFMSIRFVPLFRRRLHQITLVQQTKGISIRHGSLTKRMRDGMLLLRVLLTWSLEEALQTSDSMKARGYGTTRRSVYVVYRMERRDWTLLIILCLLGLSCILGRISGYGTLEIYPMLETIRYSTIEWILYFIFCLYLFLPMFIEINERLKWK
ncbi:energy-coupling factor transporter transmembrane component T [Bacillus sp. EAC]|uniref:energy-coupling factor transporter transmembrane component T n=1 Tax=Bacillus sp. EAC TaxID=1978338 RepID=UPI000B42EDC1|nr:energy-coupling factor transporter transmembrane component T [Bacillus sp. EAC]